MIRAAATLVLVACATLHALAHGLPESGRRVHIPPPVALVFSVDDEAIHCEVRLWATLYEELLPYKGEDAGKTPLPDAVKTAVAKLFAEKMNVRLGTKPAVPQVRKMGYEEGNEGTDFIPYVVVYLAYPTATRARRFGAQWTGWECLTGYPSRKIPLLVDLEESDHIDVTELTDVEPEHVWHAPSPRMLRPAAPVEPVVPRIAVPLLAVVLGLGTVCGFFLKGRRPVILIVGGTLSVAAGVSGVGSLDVEDPWGGPSLDREAAASTFESLLRGIYRAFDYETESGIYDALAKSVHANLIDTVYAEVYESLILRDEGGAVCDVTSVRMLHVDAELPSDATPSYTVEALWQVQGTVEHHEHKHLRTNQYHAIYTVLWDGERWLLTAVDLKEKKRIGSDVGLYR